MNKKTLVIILNQNRDLQITFTSLEKFVLEPLKADVAFCGNWDFNSGTNLLSKFSYFWNHDEPKDWLQEINKMCQEFDSNWEKLIPFGHSNESHFMGPTKGIASKGSGIIGHYWRHKLAKEMNEEILSSYEWFVITRSDYLWEIPHPNVENLSSHAIYTQYKENYGGINDRHMLIPRTYIKQIMKIPKYIFENADETEVALSALELRDLNPEKFLKFLLSDLELLDKVIQLPHMGYTIRAPKSTSRWQHGTFNKSLGLFVKYQSEYDETKKTKKYIKKSNDWIHLLSQLRKISTETTDLSSIEFDPFPETQSKVSEYMKKIVDVIRYPSIVKNKLRKIAANIDFGN